MQEVVRIYTREVDSKDCLVPTGELVAVVEDGLISIGWSSCRHDSKVKDQFSYEVSNKIALGRAAKLRTHEGKNSAIPDKLKPHILRCIKLALKKFPSAHLHPNTVKMFRDIIENETLKLNQSMEYTQKELHRWRQQLKSS